MARYVKVLTSDQSTPKVAGVPAEWTDVEDLTGVQPKRYVALLTQSGTNAPSATVLENTLGGTVVWTRNGAGSYFGTLAGAFPETKSVVFSPGRFVGLEVYPPDYFAVSSYSSSGDQDDDQMHNTSVEIRVYP